MRLRAALITVLVLLLAAGVVVYAARPGPVRTGPTRYVSPRGSDLALGTAAHPWRSLPRALRQTTPGETIVLAPGVYGRRGRRLVWSDDGTARRPVTIEGVGSRPSVILGYNKVTGRHLILRDLLFQGPTGAVDPRTAADPGGQDVPLWLAGSYISLVDSQVADSLWHAGIYVYGGPSIRIVDVYVHDNGDFARSAQANLDQGIYWGRGSSGLIEDCLIVHNLANGVQLYPAADGVTVERDTIVDNGRSGVIVAGSSAGDVIADDILADNTDEGARSFALSGGGDAVFDNLLWQNGSDDPQAQAAGLSTTDNLIAAPSFVGPHDFRLRNGSPALGRAIVLDGLGSGSIDAAAASAPRAGNIGAYQGPGVQVPAS